MLHISVYILDSHELSGHEDACASLVAAAYQPRPKDARLDRLERLGSGLLLAHVLGVTDDSRLALSPHGKPRLSQPGAPHFNLSHDAGLIGLAVASEPVGIDVQAIGIADESVVSRFFPLDAQAEFLEASMDRKPLVFAHHWTVLEACLKAHGTGFDIGRDEILGIVSQWATQTWQHAGAFMISCAAAHPFELSIHELAFDCGHLHERAT